MNRAIFLAAVLAVTGCASPRPSREPVTTRSDAAERGDFISVLLAPAGAASERALVPVAWMGGLLMLAGAVWSVVGFFTGKGLAGGAVLFATGAAMVGCAVLYLEYPWVCIIGAALYTASLVALWSSTRTKNEKMEDTLEVLVQEVDECGDAVKARIRARGQDTEDAVREVVAPIKRRLRKKSAMATFHVEPKPVGGR